MDSLSTCFLAYRLHGTIFVLDETVWTGVSKAEIIQSFKRGSQMPHQVELQVITDDYHTRLQQWGMLHFQPSNTVTYHKSLNNLVASGHFRAFLVVFKDCLAGQHMLGNHRFNACLAAMPAFGPDPASDPALDLERGMLDEPPATQAQLVTTTTDTTPQPAQRTNKNNRRKCGNCQRTKKDIGSRLLRCSRCDGVHYCNKACQRLHWPQHKQVCETL